MATKWLTPREAAARLGISESTLWRLLRRGALESVKVGGRRRIPPAALRRLSQAGREAVSPHEIPPLTLDNVLFRLAGRFRSDGSGPGASDKHFYLGKKP